MVHCMAGFTALLCMGVEEKKVAPGEAAPALTNVQWVRGDSVDQWAVGRIYVVEFWSTWCGACVESIDSMNSLARRHQDNATFLAVHVWQKDGSPTPSQFIHSRTSEGRPIWEFPVADDVDGATAKAWMDATGNSGLPTAMIVDRGSRLAWFGHARDLEKPLSEIVQGSYDLERGRDLMNRRIRVGQMADASDRAIESGDYERGIKTMLEAFELDPDTVRDWIPSTYGHLLAASKSPSLAAAFARSALATDKTNAAELAASFTRVIHYFQPAELRDLPLTNELAELSRPPPVAPPAEKESGADRE